MFTNKTIVMEPKQIKLYYLKQRLAKVLMNYRKIKTKADK